MSTPRKRKQAATNSECSSPKNFSWSQSMDEVLLDFLLNEINKGNRPDQTFSALAYRNIVNRFNELHGTNINKDNVKNRIRTLKSTFDLFHEAFHAMSGFAWNCETNKFEATEEVWDERVKVNPKFAKLRKKEIKNWDKLYLLFADDKATGDMAVGSRERAKRMQRNFNMDNIANEETASGSPMMGNNCCSMFGDNSSPVRVYEAHTPALSSAQPSCGSGKTGIKRKASMFTVLEDGYNTVARSIKESITELSKVLLDSGDKVAKSKYNHEWNALIYNELQIFRLDKEFHLSCYRHLVRNRAAASEFIGVPHDMRADILQEIMKDAGDAD